MSQVVRAGEKLGRFRIGVAPDRDLAGRDQVTDRLVGFLRVKEMSPEQRADVFRVRMLLDPGADGVVNLTAFGEGHRIVDDVSQDRVPEYEFVGPAVRGFDDAQSDQGGEGSLHLGRRQRRRADGAQVSIEAWPDDARRSQHGDVLVTEAVEAAPDHPLDRARQSLPFENVVQLASCGRDRRSGLNGAVNEEKPVGEGHA